MATIEIKRAHSLDRDEARRRAEGLARSMEEKLKVRWSWDGDFIRFDAPSGAAKGTSGTVRVGQAEVHVEVTLPFLLRGIKGTVEAKINQKLDALIGS